MRVFCYDGSFEGFLSVIYHSYYQKTTPEKIVKNYKESTLFDEVIDIKTDLFHAQKVHCALKEKFEIKNYKKIFNIFMCDERDFEKALYDFIVLGFKDQKTLLDINHPSIYFLECLEQEYFRYLHKMYGFIRFEELHDNKLYAKFEGKFNILSFLGEHFLKRLDGSEFILHDIKRSLAFISSSKGSSIYHVRDFDMPKLSKNEKKFQDLWKLFFKQVSIKERENNKLQQNWVPLIYRKYMSEFQS